MEFIPPTHPAVGDSIVLVAFLLPDKVATDAGWRNSVAEAKKTSRFALMRRGFKDQ